MFGAAAYCSTGGTVWLLRGLAQLFQCFKGIIGFLVGRSSITIEFRFNVPTGQWVNDR